MMPLIMCISRPGVVANVLPFPVLDTQPPTLQLLFVQPTEITTSGQQAVQLFIRVDDPDNPTGGGMN